MRRVRGGLDIIPVSDSEFKYTVDPQRILWTKNVFPISQYLLQMIQSMPWNDYRFEGETTLWTEEIVNSNSNNYNIKAPIGVMPVKGHVDNISATTEGITPYAYFGGCVYEILDTRYKHISDLRRFVDPTGDIDVAICLPNITLSIKRYYIDYHYKNYKAGENVSSLEMTELVNDYTRWIFNEFEKQLTKTIVLFEKLFENTIEFDFSEAQEGVVDLSKKIGNVWIVRSINLPESMIKIQLVCKFVGMEVAEHLIEFVLHLDTIPTSESLNHSIDVLKNESFMFESFPIMKFSQLLKGNVQTSLENRLKFWNTRLRHKFYNHVGRIQYLNSLLPKLIKRPDNTSTNSSRKLDVGGLANIPKGKRTDYPAILSYIMSLCGLLIKVINDGDICKYDYTYEGGPCNKTNIMNIVSSLVGDLIGMLFKQDKGNKNIPYILSSTTIKGKGRIDPNKAVQMIIDIFLAENRDKNKSGGNRKIYTRSHRVKRRAHKTKKRA
jgi:hypothetical protein